MKALFILVTLLLASCTTTPLEPTTQKLIGKHGLSLQWIGWEADEMGEATVARNADGVLTLTGRQDSKEGSDFLSIEGIIKEVSPRYFIFEGTIVTQVSYIAGGRPVVREGRQRFVIYGDRDYWRMEALGNPEDSVVDYIDVHF